MTTPPPPRARILVLCLLPLAARPGAGEEPRGGAGADLGNLRRSQHWGLWPFYSEDRFEDGGVRRSSLFGAIRSESHPSGDHHHRVLPLYSAALTGGGTDRRLAIFPLLYALRRSPDLDYDLALPLFARWRSRKDHNVLLWPLFHVAARADPGPFRLLPALYGHGAWEGGSEDRLGVPYVVELFERAATPARSAWRAGVFFPWGKPTGFGLALGESSREWDGSWHAHVFPLSAAGWKAAAPGTSYFHTPLFGTWARGDEVRGVVLPPLLTWWWVGTENHDAFVLLGLFRHRRGPERHTWWLLPFYLSHADGDEELRCWSLLWWRRLEREEETTRHILPLLLSGWRHGPEERALDILWPLFHSSARSAPRGETRTLRILPFYDDYEDPARRILGVGGILYRRHEELEAERVNEWYLWPLGRYDRSPRSSLSWALPVWFGLRRTEAGERTTARVLLPFFASYRREVRETRAGEESRDSPGAAAGESWRLAHSWLHLWPLYGVHTSRDWHADREWESRRHFTLAPLMSFSRTVEVTAGEVSAWDLNAPWPLLEYAAGEEGAWDFRLFPVLFAGSRESRDYTYTYGYTYLYPLLAVESGFEARAGFWHWTSFVQWYDDPGESYFRLFPFLFTWRESGGVTQVTGPLWWFHYRASADEGWFHLLPLGFGAWGENRSRMGVFPLFYRRWQRGEPIDYWPVARFFVLWTSLASEDEAYDAFLWKAVEHTRSANGDFDFRILHRLFVNRRVAGQRELVLNPFFGYEADERRRTRAFSFFKYLYRSEVRDGIRTRRLFGIPISRDPAGP